jgi:hypothetical protein
MESAPALGPPDKFWTPKHCGDDIGSTVVQTKVNPQVLMASLTNASPQAVLGVTKPLALAGAWFTKHQ